MTLADLDRAIEAMAATLADVWDEGEAIKEGEGYIVAAHMPYGDVLRAREALTLLRAMREGARLGTAWKDGDFFCAQPDGRCEDSASWLFAPVCEHEPEPEVVARGRARQFAALLITPEDV